jgi:anti-sigma factor RsiW
MTCPDRTHDLALYVGGDLPDEGRDELERHLRECAACRVFLAELETSQAAVTDLVAEPVPQEIRHAVRARVASAGRQRPDRRAAWTVAAGLAAAAVATGFWLAAPAVRQPDSTPTTTPHSEGSLARRSGTPAASIAAGPSAVEAPQRRHPTAKPARRIPPPPPSSTSATLTTAEADQLARAVVAISQVDHVSEPPPQPLAETKPSAFVRIATDDPDVVIYWRLDSDGGD